MLESQRAVDAYENILKNLITDKFTEIQPQDLVPAETLVAVPEVLDRQESWRRGLQQRPDLAQAKLDLERGELRLKYDKNQLFPQLDLIGQYGYAGSGREFAGAFGQIRTTDNPFWYYGAQISYPIGNVAGRNNYKTSKAEKKQAELLLKQKEQEILVEIDDAVKLVQTAYQRVNATRAARAFAEAALDAEQKKLENGKSTSFLVLQFQRDLTNARFQEIRALADYNNALATLAFREGNTLERHKLNVNIR
jgi:outer membrane protein TolC